MALEALEEATGYTSCTTWSPSMTDECASVAEALRAALAQPEQEPVAYQWLGTSVIRKRVPKTGEADAWQPLYTAPPQRKSSSQEAMTRKPLTDDEIKNIVDLGLQTWKLSESTYAFARAIEAAHGIGGEE